MTDTFTLVHLSDVHLGPIAGFHPRHWNLKRGLGFLNWQRGRRHVHRPEAADAIAADALAQAPDHIAVTGDLANLGLPGEYARALGWLEALGPPDRVSVVPGNHDIYTGRLGTDSCLVTWAPYMRGDGTAAGAAVSFPYVRRIGRIALVGLCSAVPTPPFVAAGRLGAEQIARAADVLAELGAEGRVRVVLIHHPPLPGQAPPRRALADAPAFAEALARAGAELVLHGHNHSDMLAWAAAARGRPIPVLGIASASAARVHGAEPLARYHLLRIRPDATGAEIQCETRGLAVHDGAIVSLGRRTLAAPT